MVWEADPRRSPWNDVLLTEHMLAAHQCGKMGGMTFDARDPVEVTVRTYTEHFGRYVAGTEPTFSNEFRAWTEGFLERLPPGSSVLEIGSGHGRAASICREFGVDVLCTDVVPDALHLLRAQGFMTAPYDFRDEPPKEWRGAFGGIFANAVLLHAPRGLFVTVLKRLATCMRDDGTFAFSLKSGTGDEYTSHKVGGPRFFQYYSEEEVRVACAAASLHIFSLVPAKHGTWWLVTACK